MGTLQRSMGAVCACLFFNTAFAVTVLDDGFDGPPASGGIPPGWTLVVGNDPFATTYAASIVTIQGATFMPGGTNPPTTIGSNIVFDPQSATSTVTMEITSKSTGQFGSSISGAGLAGLGRALSAGLDHAGSVVVRANQFGSTAGSYTVGTIPGYTGGGVLLTIEYQDSGFRVTTDTGIDSGQVPWSNLSPFVDLSSLGSSVQTIAFTTVGPVNTVGIDRITVDSVPNPAVVADAGPDQTVDETDLVTLDGSGSAGAANYSWSQVAGPTVNLSSTTAVNPQFTAPYLSSNTTLTFQLIIDDGAGNFSDPDTVNITVVNVNNPPVSDAGNDATIKEGAVATLDGSNSFDPEGDAPLSYSWNQVSGIPVTLLPSANVMNPSLTAPLGVGNQLVFSLEVGDGKEFSDPDDTVTISVVANSPPVADAGPDQTVLEGALVSLNGTNSSDPDGGDTLSFDWTEPVALSDDMSPTPSFTAPAVGPGGTTLTFDLDVSDNDPVNPLLSSDQVVITVQNANDPPNCSLATASCSSSKIKNNNGCTLWPPNHKMVDVSIVGVADPDNDAVAITVTGVTQDEPTNGLGDGDTSPDAILSGDSALIRSERAGGGNGRVYAVQFTADDGQGGTCNGSVEVGVPHNRKATPVDDGQAHDSTQP